MRLSANDTIYMDEWQTIEKDNGETTTTTTTKVQPTKIKGDVNGDGVVNTLDVQALLKIVSAGKQADPETSDIDNNGRVDVLDIKALLFKLL